MRNCSRLFPACASRVGDRRKGYEESLPSRPDGQCTWVAPNALAALGHSRLSIIDLTMGDQPIANENETLRIVVNGEFYGYEAIQKEFEQRGHWLRTRSDSEIGRLWLNTFSPARAELAPPGR